MSETGMAMAGKSGINRGFEKDVQRLGQYVGQLRDDLAGIAKGVGEVAQSGAAVAEEGAKNTLEAAKKRGQQATVSLRDRMVDHPGTTLGVAVGVGVLIGLLAPAILRSRGRSS
jgi:ElaB/YqjD/DUF883 family membrane-anchored ribosome-binding protein